MNIFCYTLDQFNVRSQLKKNYTWPFLSVDCQGNSWVENFLTLLHIAQLELSQIVDDPRCRKRTAMPQGKTGSEIKIRKGTIRQLYLWYQDTDILYILCLKYLFVYRREVRSSRTSDSAEHPPTATHPKIFFPFFPFLKIWFWGPTLSNCLF
jgi:hypothetical protein